MAAMMTGNMLILLVSLDVIHLTQQMPFNSAHIESYLDALNSATNNFLPGIEECFEQYISNSVLGIDEYGGNEGTAESISTISYRILERCIRASMVHTEMEQKEHIVLGGSRKQLFNREVLQISTPGNISGGQDQAPSKKPKSNFINKLLAKLKALKQMITSKVGSGTKNRLVQGKPSGNAVNMTNRSRKELSEPPYSTGRFRK